MIKSKSSQKTKPSLLVQWARKLMGVFDWIAQGQSAEALCKG